MQTEEANAPAARDKKWKFVHVCVSSVCVCVCVCVCVRACVCARARARERERRRRRRETGREGERVWFHGPSNNPRPPPRIQNNPCQPPTHPAPSRTLHLARHLNPARLGKSLHCTRAHNHKYRASKVSSPSCVPIRDGTLNLIERLCTNKHTKYTKSRRGPHPSDSSKFRRRRPCMPRPLPRGTRSRASITRYRRLAALLYNAAV